MFDPRIFRNSAIQHYLSREGESAPVPLRIAPAWTWWFFWVISVAVILAFTLAIFLKVDVQAVGSGVIRIAGGARSLTVQISGRVARVNGVPGQKVKPGELILELESAEVQAQLFEAERAFSQYEQITRNARVGLDRLAEIQIREAVNRQEIQKDQLHSQEASIHLFERKLAATEELGRYGLVSSMSVDSAREELAQAKRSVNNARQSELAGEQEVASLRG